MYWNNSFPIANECCGYMFVTDGFSNGPCDSNLRFVLEFESNAMPLISNFNLGDNIPNFTYVDPSYMTSCNSAVGNSNGNFYYYSNFTTSWFSADSICNSLGGIWYQLLQSLKTNMLQI